MEQFAVSETEGQDDALNWANLVLSHSRWKNDIGPEDRPALIKLLVVLYELQVPAPALSVEVVVLPNEYQVLCRGYTESVSGSRIFDEFWSDAARQSGICQMLDMRISIYTELPVLQFIVRRVQFTTPAVLPPSARRRGAGVRGLPVATPRYRKRGGGEDYY